MGTLQTIRSPRCVAWTKHCTRDTLAIFAVAIIAIARYWTICLNRSLLFLSSPSCPVMSVLSSHSIASNVLFLAAWTIPLKLGEMGKWKNIALLLRFCSGVHPWKLAWTLHGLAACVTNLQVHFRVVLQLNLMALTLGKQPNRVKFRKQPLGKKGLLSDWQTRVEN